MGEEPKKRLADSQIRRLERMYEAILHAEPSLRSFDVEVRITRKGDPPAFGDREALLVGWGEIGEFMGLHQDTCARVYGREFREEGVVFHKKVRRPGATQARRFVCTWPTLVMAWSVRRSRTRRTDLRRSVLDILRRMA